MPPNGLVSNMEDLFWLSTAPSVSPYLALLPMGCSESFRCAAADKPGVSIAESSCVVVVVEILRGFVVFTLSIAAVLCGAPSRRGAGAGGNCFLDDVDGDTDGGTDIILLLSFFLRES